MEDKRPGRRLINITRIYQTYSGSCRLGYNYMTAATRAPRF